MYKQKTIVYYNFNNKEETRDYYRSHKTDC